MTDKRSNYMKGEKGLKDQPFRYGGIAHDYDMDCEEWAEIVPRMRTCFVCGKEMKNIYDSSGVLLGKTYPYIGTYIITKGPLKGHGKFRTICRACAYDYGHGVIEMDGNTYQSPEDFNETQYKESNQNRSELKRDVLE